MRLFRHQQLQKLRQKAWRQRQWKAQVVAHRRQPRWRSKLSRTRKATRLRRRRWTSRYQPSGGGPTFLPTPREQPARGQIQLVADIVLNLVPRGYAVLQLALGYILSAHDKANNQRCKRQWLLAEFEVYKGGNPTTRGEKEPRCSSWPKLPTTASKPSMCQREQSRGASLATERVRNRARETSAVALPPPPYPTVVAVCALALEARRAAHLRGLRTRNRGAAKQG
jgi:hypothetical protein